MPTPKRRLPQSRTRMRRSHDALSKPNLSRCKNCGVYIPKHVVCPDCGFYKGKSIVTEMVRKAGD